MAGKMKHHEQIGSNLGISWKTLGNRLGEIENMISHDTSVVPFQALHLQARVAVSGNDFKKCTHAGRPQPQASRAEKRAFRRKVGAERIRRIQKPQRNDRHSILFLFLFMFFRSSWPKYTTLQLPGPRVVRPRPLRGQPTS